MKKSKIIKKVLFVVLLITIISSIVIFTTKLPTFADAGSVQRYDSSGYSSGSSSSSSSRSSYSSGSSYSSSSSGGSGGGSIFGVIFVVVVIVIIVLSSKKGGGINIPTGGSFVQPSGNVENQIKQIDPMFSAENFMTYAREAYVKLQHAWMNRDLEPIRLFVSNEMFQQYENQLSVFIQNKQINMMDRINVRSTRLLSFAQSGDKEVLTMELKAVMRDYIIEEETKKVIEGNPNTDMYMVYTLTFIRKAGVKTKEGTSQSNTTNCPNCGAPTKITSSGKCEYCGSVITTGEHGWILSEIKGRPGM